MNRNVESHFAQLPRSDIERSIFDRSFEHLTTGNVGELIPFYWDEILPGDTFNVTTSFVARLQTLLTPIMANLYMDTYFFFVPSRLCWTHWKEFMGENNDSPWLPTVTYSMPKISSPSGGWNVGTIADYMGIPVGQTFDTVANGSDGLMPDALPFRAYALICNEWFRDQNLTDPLNIPTGDSNQTGSNGSSYINDVANGGKPFKVAKYHDYFTSCLPAPQKGPSVTFGANPVVTGSGDIPVRAMNTIIPPRKDFNSVAWYGFDNTSTNGYFPATTNVSKHYLSAQTGSTFSDNITRIETTSGTDQIAVTPVNLWADVTPINLAASGVSFSINELRLAFQLQKFYEKNARGGSRYRELLKVHFGVTSPDARMMIPEYLGGHRIPIQISQVVNSASSSGEYLGDLGAMSNTNDLHNDFIKSFTEHGYVIGVFCVRYDHSYPQGLERSWCHNSSLDYYWPVFANIGEQPVYKYEIDASVRTGEDRLEVFGFNEGWASYRYKPSRVSGEMRPGISNTLSSWHLSDYYTAMPSLSDAWIREDPSVVDRVLAVGSSVSNQVFVDFYVRNRCTRAMPMYSVPGLIDHH